MESGGVGDQESVSTFLAGSTHAPLGPGYGHEFGLSCGSPRTASFLDVHVWYGQFVLHLWVCSRGGTRWFFELFQP